MSSQTTTRKAILNSIAFSGSYCVRTHMKHKETMAALLRSMEREGILEETGRDGPLVYYKKAPEEIIPVIEMVKATVNEAREIQQIDMDGIVIRTYKNAAEVARFGYSPRVAAQSCKELRYYAGCRWIHIPKPVPTPVPRTEGARTDNKSGVPGVFRNRTKTGTGKPWTAVMTIKGKNTTKSFRTKGEAIDQRVEWEEEHYVRRSR